MVSTGLMVFWFVFVVACIPVCLWLVKRSGMAKGMGVAEGSLLKQVGQLNLGPGQRLVTVEVGEGAERKWLVLGVTAQSITRVHEMTPSEDIPLAQPVAGHAFASVLNRFAQRPVHGPDQGGNV